MGLSVHTGTAKGIMINAAGIYAVPSTASAAGSARYTNYDGFSIIGHAKLIGYARSDSY